MPRIVIRTRLSPAQVARLVAGLAKGALSGPDAAALQTAVGTVALAEIKRAFLQKSRGGTDEAGQTWAPLSPATVARKRKAKGGTRINRDTGALHGSLSLNVSASQGAAIVADVPHAEYVHAVRPLWPSPANWPSRWWLKMGAAARDVLVAILRRELGGG